MHTAYDGGPPLPDARVPAALSWPWPDGSVTLQLATASGYVG